MENQDYRNLNAVEGVDESLADRLFAAGFTSPAALAAIHIEELMSLARIDEDKAHRLLRQSAAAVAGVAVAEDQPVRTVDPEQASEEQATEPEQPAEPTADEAAESVPPDPNWVLTRFDASRLDSRKELPRMWAQGAKK